MGWFNPPPTRFLRQKISPAGAAFQFVHGRWALEDQSAHVVVVSKSTVPCLHETGPGASETGWGVGEFGAPFKKQTGEVGRGFFGGRVIISLC